MFFRRGRLGQFGALTLVTALAGCGSSDSSAPKAANPPQVASVPTNPSSTNPNAGANPQMQQQRPPNAGGANGSNSDYAEQMKKMQEQMKSQNPNGGNMGNNNDARRQEEMKKMQQMQQQMGSNPNAGGGDQEKAEQMKKQQEQMKKQQEQMKSQNSQAGSGNGNNSGNMPPSNSYSGMPGGRPPGQGSGQSNPNAPGGPNGQMSGNPNAQASMGQGGNRDRKFTPGSIDEVLFHFCTAMADNDTATASDYISPKATGVLAKLRDGTMPEESIDELVELFNPVTDLRPMTDQAIQGKRTLINGKNQIIGFAYKKEKDGIKITEITVPKKPRG